MATDLDGQYSAARKRLYYRSKGYADANVRQDLAGLGGDVKFLRTSEDARYYQSPRG
ncbi:hypothetical protein [Bradyrhizobium cenepequi]|uniref:hypothetical protein n=1 Tax=Bradyrhizobium cenepequi TaxID=2821403 RepID=UPI001CE2BFE0|nr:hypothetical protein [Bradyrhizobium cenepequi]